MVVVGDPLVVHYDIRDLSFIKQINKRVVDEVQEDDVHVWVGFKGMTDNAFHSENLLFRAEEVGVVIDRGLNKQKVRHPLGQHVLLETESVRS